MGPQNVDGIQVNPFGNDAPPFDPSNFSAEDRGLVDGLNAFQSHVNGSNANIGNESLSLPGVSIQGQNPGIDRTL